MRPMPPGEPGQHSTSHFGVAGLFVNPSLLAALLSCFVAQVWYGWFLLSVRFPAICLPAVRVSVTSH
jgi:hypothetical protein